MTTTVHLMMILCTGLWAGPLVADPARVERTVATLSGPGQWRFDVTVSHPDTGWEHYADAWEVLAPDGTVLGERILAHPHVDEQPFTRSLFDVAIPANVARVTLRARCLRDGWTGPSVTMDLPGL